MTAIRNFSANRTLIRIPGLFSALAALLLLCLTTPVQAFQYFEAQTGGCKWGATGAGNVDFVVDATATTALGTALLAEATAAKDRWNNIATALDVFGDFTQSPTNFDRTNFGTAWGIGASSGTSDGQNEVVLDEDGAIIREIFSRDPAELNGLGITRRVMTGGSCTITDAFNLLNNTRTNFDRASTTFHEFGHIQGLAHSSVGEFNSNNTTAFNGGYGSPSSALRPINIADVPTMHPFSTGTGSNRQTPEADDVAGLSRLYPGPSFAISFGTISGTVKRCSNDAAMSGVNVRAVSTSNNSVQVSRYTGFDGNATGGFEINGLPPGSYAVVVEEMGHNRFTADRMAIVTGVDQGFPFEHYGPTETAENECSEDTTDAALPVTLAAAGSSSIAVKVNDGVRLAFVVDDTGSMSSEISAVRDVLNAIVDERVASGEPFPRTAVVSFKDDVTRRIVSDQPDEIRPVVNGLFASGGSDCPESSNAAIFDAGRILDRGGKAIMFTDADSRADGPTRASVLEYYRGRGLALSVLLSATCSEVFASTAAAHAAGAGTLRAPRYGQGVDGSAHEPSWASPERMIARVLPSLGAATSEEFDAPPTLGPENAFVTNSGLAVATGGVFVATPRPTGGDARTAYINAGVNIGLGSVTASTATVVPQSVPRGATVTVDLRGASTNWTSASTVEFIDTSITIVNRQTLSPNMIRARITVPAAQTTGFFDVRVRTVLAAGAQEVATGIGALQVTLPATGGEIVGVTPASGGSGTTQDVSIFGLGTTFGVTSVVQFRRFGGTDPDITLNSVNVVSPTELRASITVASDAEPGLRDVGVDGLTEIRGFAVTEPPPAIPIVTALTPNQGVRGVTGLAVAVTGENTRFDTASTVSLGAGVTVTDVSVTDAAHLTATISIDAAASLGFRDLTVDSGGEVAAILAGFQIVTSVEPPPPPPDGNCDDMTPSNGCTVNGVANQACQATSRSNTIIGTSARDVIRGGPGKDTLEGRGGNDLICGDEGNDTLRGGDGNDELIGGPGNDRVEGGNGNDQLKGNDGADDLRGGNGNDSLKGGRGRDICKGEAGRDTARECERSSGVP